MKFGPLGAGAFLLGSLLLQAQSGRKQPYITWSDYGGSADSMQYSALKQINKINVNQLDLAWFLPAPGPSGRFAFNPLIVDGVMYVIGKDDTVLAVHAATGKQVWSHPVEGAPTNRGFNYWESKDRSDRRLIFAANSYLQEIDLRTGVTIPSFGNDGRVNLREGLGRNPKSIAQIQSGTPGRVFENLVILGSAPGEGYGSPPGDLRAYDVLTGKLIWTFHTIPRPGEYGYDTWPKEAWKYAGGTNTWGEISIDVKRGIAYFPIGAPTYDFYGADRIGADLFGDCLLALDARTGKRLWHFQLIHHDLWDYDPATAPKLLTVKHNGRMVDIVAQPTKSGFLYVFNRVTGEPLWPIEERPVPKSDVPGERSWPTQPFPTKPPPFARQKFTVDDLNPYLDAAETARWREIILNARNEGVFTPPSAAQNAIQVPGELGGAEPGGAAGDPLTGMLYVRVMNGPAIHKLTQNTPGQTVQGGTPEQQGHALYTQLCEGCHGPDRARVASPTQVGVDRFKNSVRRGQGDMPAFADLSEQNLDALAAYIADPAAGAAPVSAREGASHPPPGQTRYYGQYANLMVASSGLPAIAPPWSALTAYDLNEGTIKWQIPLGSVPALAEKGIKNTGGYRPTRNGLVVTSGGLIFVASASDHTLHAYDKDNGRVLWEKELEANPEGIPAVYEIGGRQYIAFWAMSERRPGADAASWKPGQPAAQGYYVFALPKTARSAGK